MSTRRTILIRAALIATPIVAFFLYAALNWFVIEEESRRVGMKAEAIRDPYLAYTRLLRKMGNDPTLTDVPSRLDTPPEKGTLVLASRRLVYMSAARVAKLTDWVERGGTLVVEAEPYGIDDPLLDALGIKREDPAMDPVANKPFEPRRFRKSSAATFDWRGRGEPLRVNFGRQAPALEESVLHPGVSAASAEGDYLAFSFTWGDGRVVALSSLTFLRNNLIGELDHAELGWRLASSGNAQAPPLVFLKPPRAALGEWLVNEAWTALVAAAMLLVLWLARIIPRFGPLVPEPQPARRSLAEHVAASGRFLWSRGEKRYLAEAARERVLQAMSRRFGKPQPLRLPAVETEAGFVAAMARFSDLESRLGRRAAPKLLRKEPA